jgi:glucokinase
MATNRIALGIDIGGTKIKAIALKTPTEIIDQVVVPSYANQGPEAVRTAIHEVVEYFQGRNIPFECIGVGCAGSVDHVTGTVRNSPNFSHWKNVCILDWIQKDFQKPGKVENDANCAVVAEWKAGYGQGYRNVVLLTIGTGIGGGLILNGKLFRGSTGTAGELGHISIQAQGIECPCGNRGCFERYCSATAVKEKAGGRSSKEIFTNTSEDPLNHQIVEEFLNNFKVGLTSIANAFDPDLILLGGAVSEGLSRYREELLGWLRLHAFPAVGKHVRLEMTKFDNLSGAMGAALIALGED